MKKTPLHRLARALRLWVIRQTTEISFLLVLAVLVGLGGGLGAVGFRWLIRFFNGAFLGHLRDLVDRGGELVGVPYLLPLVPAAGGLVVGFIVVRWAREARGHGVPEVMAAVATEHGRIRPRLVFLKALASAVCIGSGGSAGREGPIVQIGSALASGLGQFFGLTPHNLRIMVGCGAAAGISGTFNAPIAGALFALEVIVGDFNVRTFSPIIVSSVLATALARSVLGNEPAFMIPHYETVSPYELIYYALLGMIIGVLAVAFTRLLYRLEDGFDWLPVSDYLRPVLGGLLVGVVAIFFPQVMGVGYEAITDAILGHFGITLVFILFGAKLLATCLTLGSGGSGGIFAPSLFMGAMAGAAFGHVAGLITPNLTASPGAYALVGMAAMVAGTTHAPLTAMLILFELTDDYKVILPVMLATVISTLVARRLSRDSIYTLKLSRRGLHIAQGIDMSILESIRVDEVMDSDPDAVRTNSTLREIVELLQISTLTDFPVVDSNRNLEGMVSFQDIRSVLTSSELRYLVVAADAMHTDSPTVQANATLLEVLQAFSEADVQYLPVVEGNGSRRLVGVIHRANLMTRYDQELRRRIGN